jgi:hypothetical protein
LRDHVAKKKRMSASPVKTALEELLKTRRLHPEGPPLRGERRMQPVPTGIGGIDELIGGGLPRGQLSEVHGPASSGRTGLALATVAGALARGALAAWIDPGDRFDPSSAAEAGIDLGRLLWLRGRSHTPVLPRAVSATATVLGASLFELVVLDLAGLPRGQAARLPHTTWLRLQRTVESVPAALVLLADAHVAHGPGGVSLALSPAGGAWSGHGPGRVLTGLAAEVHAGQRRLRGTRFELQAFA